MEKQAKKLVFENGRTFIGKGFGADQETVAEVVFNTSMVGYQEIMSDPGYCGRMVVMTYPLIGNCGLTDDDYETQTPSLGGLIVRDYNDFPSNHRYTKTLAEEMEECGIPGIEGVDTREITRMLQREGAMRAVLTDAARPLEALMEQLRLPPEPRNRTAEVSCKKLWYSRTSNYRYNVVAVDCGIRHSMIRSLNLRGCNVIVVPYDTAAERVMALRPDGLFLSNGPGDPAELLPVAELVRNLQGRLPIFGVCLGHQIIALANGAETYRLKCGHHGGHPVQNLTTGRIEMTSQSHSFAVDKDSVDGTGLTVTHVNLLDGTVEGLEKTEDCVFSVQYHPENAPGARDSAYLFDLFIARMGAFWKGRVS